MADSKAHKPGGLLDQYNLLGAIIDASWATRLDHKVARHIIDRYYPKHGNGRASLRYLERETGASRPNIIASVRRLAEQGAITMVRAGRGTRPTEFALNFDFPASGIAGDTARSDSASGIVGDTSSGIVGDTSKAASGIVGDTESYLQVPAYKAGIQIDRDDTRPPTAPLHGDGLAATPARGSAVEEEENDIKATFELLWRTYDFKRGKDEARKAWNALPAEVDKAAVIEVAKAWQASWAAQGKPDAPRKHLATWLTKELYDEDPPTGYVKPEKAKPAKSPKAPKPGTAILKYTIVSLTEEGSPFENYFNTFTFRAVDGGHEIRRRFHIVQANADYGEGKDVAQYHELCRAAFGKGNPIEEWVGRVIGVSDEAGEEVFWHCPDDNLPPDDYELTPEPLSTPASNLARAADSLPIDFGTNEWERRKEEQWRRDAGRKEWDEAHPELFEDKPAANDDWPAWMDDDYERDDEAA